MRAGPPILVLGSWNLVFKLYFKYRVGKYLPPFQGGGVRGKIAPFLVLWSWNSVCTCRLHVGYRFEKYWLILYFRFAEVLQCVLVYNFYFIDFFSNGEEKIHLVRFDNSNYVKNGILILNFNLIVISRCFPTLNKYLLNSYSLSH